MERLSRKRGNRGESARLVLSGLPALEAASRRTNIAEERSALILRFLRQKARRSRNKKPQPFFSIRAVASHFAVPPTTVSRIYTQLKDEGLLASVWGSKTFVEPVQIDNQLRVRAVVALPASLTSFCTVRQYRNFFLEMRDALWKSGFATRLLFYEGNTAQLPSFAELLLDHKPDIVIWFLPIAKTKGTVARLRDHGIRVITVTDCPRDCREHPYYVDRERAIKNALLNWQRNGIRSITMLHHSHCGSASTIETCLRDSAMPYTLGNVESWQSQEIYLACSQKGDRGVIFLSSELAAALAARDPARFAKLFEQSRLLLMDGPIDVPGSCAVNLSIDVVEVDVRAVAKRITSDLIRPIRSGRDEPVAFEATWVPAASKNRP